MDGKDETVGLLVTYVEEAKQFNDVGNELYEIRKKAEALHTRIGELRDKLVAKARNHSLIVNAILNGSVGKIKVEFYPPTGPSGSNALFSLWTQRAVDIDAIERILQLAFENDIASHMNELREIREALKDLNTHIIPDV